MNPEISCRFPILRSLPQSALLQSLLLRPLTFDPWAWLFIQESEEGLMEGGKEGQGWRWCNTDPEKIIITNTSIKKTSCYSSQQQHIQLTNTHQHQASIYSTRRTHTYAFKNRWRERAHRQRLWWAESVLLEVMKDISCSNTPENMLVWERKQEHQIQTCFYSSHLILLFPLIYPSPSLVLYYIQWSQ